MRFGEFYHLFSLFPYQASPHWNIFNASKQTFILSISTRDCSVIFYLRQLKYWFYRGKWVGKSLASFN